LSFAGIETAMGNRLPSTAINGTVIDEESDILLMYVTSFYWSTMNLLTIGNQPPPQNNGEFIFHILQTLFSVLMIATVVGQVTSLVASADRQRAEFLFTRDSIKRCLYSGYDNF
jgi:hypothetical protein